MIVAIKRGRQSVNPVYTADSGPTICTKVNVSSQENLFAIKIVKLRSVQFICNT